MAFNYKLIFDTLKAAGYDINMKDSDSLNGRLMFWVPGWCITVYSTNGGVVKYDVEFSLD